LSDGIDGKIFFIVITEEIIYQVYNSGLFNINVTKKKKRGKQRREREREINEFLYQKSFYV
jgi:hypothetical protein